MELKRFAEIVLFNKLRGTRFSEQNLIDFNTTWEFRKGKTVGDIHNALSKALKNGRQKFEYEVDMLTVYYEGIFKKRKVIKNDRGKEAT